VYIFKVKYANSKIFFSLFFWSKTKWIIDISLLFFSFFVGLFLLQCSVRTKSAKSYLAKYVASFLFLFYFWLFSFPFFFIKIYLKLNFNIRGKKYVNSYITPIRFAVRMRLLMIIYCVFYCIYCTYIYVAAVIVVMFDVVGRKYVNMFEIWKQFN